MSYSYGSGYSPREPDPPKPFPWKSTLIWGGVAIVGLCLLVFLFTGIRKVDNGRVGILTSWGKIVSDPKDPGIVIKLPWQKLHEMNLQTQLETAEAQAASKDLQDVKATLALNYNLEKAKAQEVFKTIGTGYKDTVVDNALQETLKATTSQFTASELITKRTEVKDLAQAALTQRLEPLGIHVSGLAITNFSFSPEFSRALEDRQVAEQAALTADAKLRQAKLDAQTQSTLSKTLSDQILAQQFLAKWDGKLPQTWTGGNLPFVKVLP